MDLKRLPPLTRFLIWRRKHISDQQFTNFLATIIGILTGFAAVFLKWVVHYIQQLLTKGFSIEYENFQYIIYPAIGIAIVVIIKKYVVKKPVGHGIPNVLYTISKQSGLMKFYHTYISFITSALTVGFGGSVGLEGPTVSTGAAIGSNIGRISHLDHKRLIMLIACGSAGAMAAIFKAPIAAVIFAVEVLMLDLTLTALVPLLISSVTAALVSYFFLGQQSVYKFLIHSEFKFDDIPYYIILGVICGILSLHFTRVYNKMDHWFTHLKQKNIWVKWIVGSIILGLLIFLLPSLYGEGYEVINASLRGNYDYLFDNTFFYAYKENAFAIIFMFLAIVLLKVVATSSTFGAGGVGGIFAPSLFVGANAGLLFAQIANLFHIRHLENANFALVGMAGMIAGVIHAPLTAIFLIAELTRGYELFIPLMIVSTISYTTIKNFEKNSVYTRQLARKGHLFTHHKDQAILKMLDLNKLIETNFQSVDKDATLRDLVKVISESKRNLFPVVDKEGVLYGIVHLNNIRYIIFKPELYDVTKVQSLMYYPNHWVSPDDTVEEIVESFQKSGHFNLPVINEGKYIGFVSKANILSKYRKLLKHFSEH
ncbi:MAG TPA: chloride channel protein [Cytophagales bacterium]|jgi:CIC family chloride channel protein|nr:chloride channel protein [Cytophagales bacterium]